MKKRLCGVRAPKRGRYVHALFSLAAGLAAGAAVRLLDIYTTNLGNIFSELSVWILLCTALAVFSANPGLAAAKVFLFCTGMLASYYLAAELTGGVYSMTFVYGWTVVAIISPFAAYAAWYARGHGAAANVLSAGIIAVMLVGEFVLFDRLRVFDIICAVLCAIVLFYRKTKV